jgi:hypothetical protein
MKKSVFLQIIILVMMTLCAVNYAQQKKIGQKMPTIVGESKIIPYALPANIQTILYDQTAGVTTYGINTQNFEASFDTYDDEAADNFTVPVGGWTINQVVVGGLYFNGAGPANSFNVRIYSDAAGIPGANVYTALAQPYSYDGVQYFTLSISPAAVLSAGNYWISVQCNMDYSVGGEFGWFAVLGAYGSVAQWQNPGGGFATTCTTWGPINGGCITGNTYTDLCFSLNYVTGPGPASNPNPFDGAVNIPAPNTTLSWTNPAGVTQVAVYFGTSPGSLSQIYSGSPVTSRPVSGLSNYTTYYWRVDETDGSGTTTGPVWSFTTTCTTSSAPWTENFESGVFPPNCWSLLGTSIWGTSTLLNSGISGYGVGTASAWANYWGVSTGSQDLISLPFNASGITNPAVKFDWAYDYYFGNDDELQISCSTDNGATWILLATGSGAYPTYGDFNLVTVNNGITSSYGTASNPVLAADWHTKYISLPAGTDFVKFTAVTAYGNNLFVDNIGVVENCNVTAPTNPGPVDGATGVAVTGTHLTWTNGANTTGVEVWFGPTGSVSKVYDGAIISNYALGTLSYSEIYQWWIVDKSATCGTQGPTWSFTTMQNPAVVFIEPFNTLSCWTAIGPLGTTNWLSSSSSNAGGTAPELELNYYPSFNGLSKFVSCNITTTHISQVHNLELKHYLNFYASPGPYLGIGISYDNGSTYTPIWEFQATSNVGPETIQTTFTPTAGTFQLVLYCNGDSYNINYWYVDDIQVSLPVPNDVGTFSIDMTFYNPGTVSPKATVKNFGTSTNTFNVQMQITGGYSSTKTVTNLAPGATQQVTFDNWNVSTIGVYTVNVCTQLGSDQNPTNDCKSGPVTITNWSIGSAMPGPEYMGSGVSYVSGGTKYLFVIGGNTNSGLDNECYKYNVNTNTWSPIASLPAGRVVLATVVVGDFIYAIGGYDVLSAPTNTVYKYDITGDAWTSVANLPVSLAWGKAVAHNNKIYVAGGYDGVSEVATVYVYDVATDSWLSATSMPAARFGGAFGITGNTLVYVAGADLSLIYADVYVGTISGGDPTLISWTLMANPFPGLKGKANFGNCEGFNLARVPKPDPNNPTDNAAYPPGTMFKFDAGAWGTDAIIVAGGDPNASWLPANPNPCYVYQPGTDTWTAKENVPIPILGAALGSANIGNAWSLIVATGYIGSGTTDATQILNENLGTTTFPLSVNIAAGWNMVSVPGTNTDGMDITHWWINHTGTVYKFVPGSGYTGITNTIPGQGYWEKNTVNQTYNTGDEWPAGGIQIVTHDPINAALGWNMFGGYEDIVDPAALTTVPAGKIVYPIYKFVPGSGYTSTTQIVPGFGYWVKVSAACQIIVPDLMAKGNAKIAEFFKDDWGKITLTDAAGGSYTLYAVKGDVDLNQYELPPLPPAGLFDVRFGSSRVAEDINTDFKSIEMRGITYPVRIKADGMDIRLMDVSGKLINTNLKDGEEITIDNASIDKVMVSGQLIPDKYSLEQNYPNPFNPSTTIEFSLPENVKNVTISVYNVLGQRVAELVNGEMLAGRYHYQWNAKNLASGMYIYELRTEKFVSIKKMMLLK